MKPAEATVIAASIALFGTLIGIVIGVVTTTFTFRQRQDELFFKSLDFLRGGSQNRNLGISAIQLYWNAKRHRDLCVSLLVGSAIYLLLSSKQGSAPHEANNLDRIMDMLLNNTRLSKAQRANYEALAKALSTKIATPGDGLSVNPTTVKEWQNKCASILARLT